MKFLERKVGIESMLLVVCLGLFLFSGSETIKAVEKPYAGQTIYIAGQRHSAFDALEKITPEFEAKTGIKVVYDQSPQKQLSEKILLDLSGGTGAYDVVGIHEIWLSQYVTPGWLNPLDDFINDPSLTDKAKLNLSDFPESFLKGFRYKGRLYGLPFYGEALMLFYNTEIFEEAGLPDCAPDTVKDLEQFAAKIKSATNKAGIAMRGTPDNRAILYTWQIFAFNNGWPGWWNEKWEPQFSRPEAVEAAKYYRDILNKYGPRGIGNYNWGDVQLLMQQGKVGIILDASNFGPRLENPTKSVIAGKVGYGLVPRWKIRRPCTLAFGLYMPTKAKHKGAAWEYMKWATSSETQLKTAMVGVRGDVTRISVMESEKFREKYWYGNGAWLDRKIISLKIGKKYYYPSISVFSEVARNVSIALSEILVGQKNALEALQEADRAIYPIMKEAGYIK